ncbi:MAG: LytTR family transcriptional regulator DNA-binding domain-containing protein [Emticicia sp.]
MLVNYKSLENIDDFRFLQKKQNYWYLCKENDDDWEKYAYVEDINSFLSQHIQFSKISESKMVNLNHYIDSLECNMENLLSNNRVPRKYLTSIKITQKILINKKNEIEVLNTGTKTAEKKKIKLENIEIDKIKYIVRVGSVTDIHFIDNSIFYVYETVKIIENKILHGSKFIRISRGCIINIEHISFFQLDAKNRFAELKIGTQLFKISRRLISKFIKKATNPTHAI